MSDLNKPIKPGDYIESGRVDDIMTTLEQGTFTVQAPLEMQQIGGGTQLRLARMDGFFAKITGGTSVYDWREIKSNADGTWSDGENRGGKAREVNGVPARVGEHVWLVPNGIDYRFQLVKKGTSSGGGGCTEYCVHVVGEGTTDPSGLGVTWSGTLSGSAWSTTGTTDDDGNACYVVPTSGPKPVVRSVMVTSPEGCATSSNYLGGQCDATFYYCKIVIRIQFTEAAEPDITWSTLYPQHDETDGDVRTLTFCALGGFPNFGFPRDVYFSSRGTVGLYTPTCRNLHLECGGEYDVDVTMGGSFDSCYFPSNVCDLGCGVPVDWGRGPSWRGVFSKRMQVRFSTGGAIDGFGPITNLFASDEGQWIDLEPTYVAGELRWVSSCRGGNGNFLSCSNRCGAFCQLNRVVPYEKLHKEFQSTQVILGQNFLSYRRFGKPGCEPASHCHQDPSCDGSNYDVDTGYLCVDYGTDCSVFPESEWSGLWTVTNPVDGLSYSFTRPFICSPCNFICGQGSVGYSFPFACRPEHSAGYLGDPLHLIWSAEVREIC